MLALTFLLGLIMVGVGLGLIFTHMPSSSSNSGGSFKRFHVVSSSAFKMRDVGYALAYAASKGSPQIFMKSNGEDDSSSSSSTPVDMDPSPTPMLFIVGVIISIVGVIAMILGGFGLAVTSFKCR